VTGYAYTAVCLNWRDDIETNRQCGFNYYLCQERYQTKL